MTAFTPKQPASLACTVSLAALMALWPLQTAQAQSQAPYPGWRGQDYRPAQPSYWASDRRPLDGSERGSFWASGRDQAPPPQPYYVIQQKAHNWRGLYGGALIGATVGDVQSHAFGNSAADLSGAIAGGYFGFDISLGNIVAGIEADAMWSLADGDTTYFGTAALTPEIDWLGSIRGRLGYAWNQFLFYGTAGLAFTKITYDIGLNGLEFDKDQTQTGFVIGGGVDMELTSSLSFRIEALHFGFGETDFKVGDTNFDADTDFTTLRAGLTLRF